MCYIKYQLSFSCYFSDWRRINFSLYRDPVEAKVLCREVKIYDKDGELLPSIPNMHGSKLNELINDYASAWCKLNYGDVIRET